MQVNPSPLQLRGERGFSMFIVLLAMFMTSMFVAAGFAIANGGLTMSVENKQRKSSYAVAEAGLGYYLKRLRENPDVWTQCATASDPNPNEKSPINQQWDGVPVAGKPDGDPRTWRKIPNVAAEYTIELLHTPGVTECVASNQSSMIDMSSGTFRIRITGRATTKGAAKRSVIVTFKRSGFLKFVYFTDQENRDPQADPSATQRAAQQANCTNRYRTARDDKGCIEIQFPSGDAINGPLHTNDESLLVCGSPRFGREKTKAGGEAGTDVIEVSGPPTGTVPNGGCGNNPLVFTPTKKLTANAKPMGLPQSNAALATVADSGGKSYTGRTVIRLKGTTMDVTNYATGTGVTTTNAPWPVNGVLYVRNGTACNGEIPTQADYDESNGCGNVYVSGTYAKPLTIAAANDVIIRPTEGGLLANRSSDSDIKLEDNSNATLGLIANNFVRVGHKVVRNSNGSCNTNNGNTSNGNAAGNFYSTQEPIVTNVRIDAAIMSLLHSFMVDNYDCGKAGTLTVNGAIVQKYRGPVGQGSGTSLSSGFLKDYWYDDRLRFRSPPYFLNPLDATWEVLNSQEQVPAR